MIQDTVNVLGIPQAREIAGTLAGQILNVLGVYWVGTRMVLCPFPCNVFVMYWPRTLALAPSGNRFQIQAYGPPCTSNSKHPQGVPDGILRVNIHVGVPLPGQRSRSHGV